MQDKIIDFLTRNIDKVAHFVIGMLICLLSSVFNQYPLFVGILTVLLFAVAKEFFDVFKRKTGFNWIDLTVTAAGALVVSGCLFLREYL